jgi:hypothetical protein
LVTVMVSGYWCLPILLESNKKTILTGSQKKNSTSGHWWIMSVILATWEFEMQRIMVWGQPKPVVSETLCPKITTATQTGGMAQVVEYLLCKCEALSSNQSHKIRKKDKKKLTSWASWSMLHFLSEYLVILFNSFY